MVMAILRVSPAGKTAAAGLPGAGAGWNEMRGCLDAKFIRLLQEADFEASLPDAACAKIKKKFMAQLDYSSCRSAATACGAMYKWADAMLNYSRVKNSIEPLERQKAELEAEAATCSAELDEAKRRQKTLKRNISRYTQEYNALLSSKEQIKRDVEQVLAKQTRATGLLSNLKVRGDSWRRLFLFSLRSLLRCFRLTHHARRSPPADTHSTHAPRLPPRSSSVFAGATPPSHSLTSSRR